MIDKQSYRPNRGEGDENQRRMRIAEESKDMIWIGTSHNGVFSVSNIHSKKPSIVAFDTANGLPHNSYNLPFKIKQNI
jgi:hypothetical protein